MSDDNENFLKDDCLYDVADICRALRVGRTKFYQEANAGTIEVVRHAGRTRATGAAIKKRIASLPAYKPRSRV